MRKILISLISILILLFVFLLGFVYANGNIAGNASFEDELKGMPNLWEGKAWVQKPDVTEFKLESSDAHTGKKSVTITNNSENDARYRQTINVKPESIYKLSCWIKTLNVNDLGKGANISVEGFIETSADIKATNQQWQLVEFYAKTGRNTISMTVTVGLGGYGLMNKGKAWFDDVSVELVDEIPNGAFSVNMEATEPDSSVKDNNSSGISGEKPSNSGTLLISTIIILIIVGGVVYFRFFSGKQKNELQSKDDDNKAEGFITADEIQLEKKQENDNDSLI